MPGAVRAGIQRGHHAKATAMNRLSTPPAADLAQLRAEHAAWSQAQFGDVSAVGPAKHLSKEALEVAAAPCDPIEHADCWMLLWDMQRRAGISDEQLAQAIREKLAVNKARAWGKTREGEAIEHAHTTSPAVGIPLFEGHAPAEAARHG